MDLILSFIKWPAIAAGVIVVVRNADIIGPLVGVIGCFFYMCGMPFGGKVIRFSFAAYLLIKFFAIG